MWHPDSVETPPTSSTLVEHLEESGFEPVLDDQRLTGRPQPLPARRRTPEDRPMLCRVHLELKCKASSTRQADSKPSAFAMPSSPLDCTVQLRDTTVLVLIEGTGRRVTE